MKLSKSLMLLVVLCGVIALSGAVWASETVGRSTSDAKPVIAESTVAAPSASGYLQKVIFTVHAQMLRWLGVPVLTSSVKESVLDTPKSDKGPQNSSTAPTNTHPKIDRDVFFDTGGAGVEK